MQVYSLRTNSWRPIDHLAHLGALTSFTCCALGGELCFVGGVLLDTDDPSAEYAQRARVRTLNLQSGVWTQLADMPIRSSSKYSRCCACRGKLYVIRHESDDHPHVLQIYDPTRRTWTRGPPLPVMEPQICRRPVMRSAGSHVFLIWDEYIMGEMTMATVFDTETCTWSAYAYWECDHGCEYFFITEQETLMAILVDSFLWGDQPGKLALRRVGPSTWAWSEVGPLLAEGLEADDLTESFAHLRA
jgi:hypothetical protein